MTIYRLTTEGDCEGRTTTTLGYFEGTLDQIVSYCIKNGISPYYNFKAELIDVRNCQNTRPIVSVTQCDYGILQYKTTEEARKELDKANALAKLTAQERKLLGL